MWIKPILDMVYLWTQAILELVYLGALNILDWVYLGAHITFKTVPVAEGFEPIATRSAGKSDSLCCTAVLLCKERFV